MWWSFLNKTSTLSQRKGRAPQSSMTWGGGQPARGVSQLWGVSQPGGGVLHADTYMTPLGLSVTRILDPRLRRSTRFSAAAEGDGNWTLYVVAQSPVPAPAISTVSSLHSSPRDGTPSASGNGNENSDACVIQNCFFPEPFPSNANAGSCRVRKGAGSQSVVSVCQQTLVGSLSKAFT